MDLGAAVREARRRQGWNQEQLGKRSGFSRQAINLLEKNGGRVSTLNAVQPHLALKFSGIPDGVTWGESVRASRLSRGRSLAETAALASVATNTLRSIETGGGSVRTLVRVLAAIAPEARARPLADKARLNNINRARLGERLRKSETYRTPRYSFTPLLDYRPRWFEGCGFDPSAGDGRMLAEIVARGNLGPHWANDIREEEAALMRGALPTSVTVTIANYLAMENPPYADFLLTNPPFTLAMDFVQKARTHVRGPICILQSVAWQGTLKRSEQLKQAGLTYVLNLSRRPKWEVDIGVTHSNIWDFAWFVFLPGHDGLPQMDWLTHHHPS